MGRITVGPIDGAISALAREYSDGVNCDLSVHDLKFITKTVIAALREPTQKTLDLMLSELDDTPANAPDPSGDDSDPAARRTSQRRLALTYGWRRAIDALVRETDAYAAQAERA